MKNLGLKNLVLLLTGAGLTTMALDAGIAHFGGGVMKHPGQLVPVLLGLTSFAVFGAVFARSEVWLRRIVRAVAAGSFLAGVAGTAFHAAALLRTLGDGGFEMLPLALTLAPPVMAPGAFAALGGLLWALASPRLGLTLRAPLPAQRMTG